MADQRLTRDELSWLLAQEARGAARALRDGVSQLAPRDPATVPSAKLPEVQVTLDALDGAIDAISQLQHRQPGPGRRGRIDAAALLMQLAPNARIAIEPGAGTEVYGDETELRRMLYVMLGQSSSPAESVEATTPEINVRRDGELVRLSVALGPDQSATAELERRWLNRMALRMGGRLELEGGDQALLLPADETSVRHEVDLLRRELEQAKQLGETYARELAEVFTAGVAATAQDETTVPTPSSVGRERFELLRGLGAALARRLRPVLEGMESDLEKVKGKLGDVSPAVQSLQQRYASMREVLGELNRVANAHDANSQRVAEPEQLVREVVAGAERRASRHGVKLVLDATRSSAKLAESQVLTVLLRSLLDHGIAATPRGGEVHVLVRAHATDAIEITVRDGGPGVPPRARDDLLYHRVDPTSMGRPAGATLLIAHTAADLLEASISLREGPDGGLEVRLVLPDAGR